MKTVKLLSKREEVVWDAVLRSGHGLGACGASVRKLLLETGLTSAQVRAALRGLVERKMLYEEARFLVTTRAATLVGKTKKA